PKDGLFTEDDISSRSSGFKYDLIIALDTADLESLGQIYDNDTEFFYKTPIINIDHHSENEEFGQINFIELTAVATGEILFSLFESYSRDLIDEDIATCLLAGIISKTKSFKTPNVTPKALLTASQLISMGARREEIVNHLYRSRPINVLKLWGRVLARLSSSLDGKLVWSTLTNMDFAKTDSREKDLDDVIDELIINIPQAKIVVIIYEKTGAEEPKPITNVLAYSAKNINSLDLIKEYNPQGTKDLALASINKPIQEAEKEILKLIEEKISKLPI
ncbi:MAG: DHH family phosphoesterase, partial [Candidatus Methanoperedens sp.]|nr:DHH family phosphoesterase [Candidatus Methanoperedens sp.]